MAAQHQPSNERTSRRRARNLSMFYSNDNFIVLLLCADGVAVILLLSQFMVSVHQLNTKSRLSQPNCEISARRACGKKRFSCTQLKVIVFRIFHSSDENCAINYTKI